jgi:NodT family efflux transporter outer membrane factor (OMF) lipoprotein
MKHAALAAALAATATALAGCHVGPRYATPGTPASAARAFIETDTRVALPAPTDPRWWHLYNDPALDALIADAFAANTDLRVAYANIARARGALRSARSGRFPSTTTSANYNYSEYSTALGSGARASGTGSTGGGGTGTGGTGAGGTGTGTGTGGTGTGTGATGGGGGFSAFDLGFAVNYEIDLFGRISNQIRAARRDLEAERALADNLRVTVAADTTLSYVDYCSATVQESVARRTLALLQRSLGITELTFEAGRGTRLDVERARTLAEQQAATIQPFEAARASARYSLAALTGRTPADLDLSRIPCTSTPHLAIPIPIGDGRALLARRPDVRAAERTLAADTARIGVATADLYPTIGLGGSAGFASGSLRQLFSASAFNWAAGPLLSWAFPNREAARGRILQAQGQAAASLATFDGTVLTALRETETALSALARELDRREALGRARDSSRIAAQIARLRFTEGIDSFLAELDADRTLAQAEAARAQSDQAIAQDQIALFLALGGGWEDAADDHPRARPIPARPGPLSRGPHDQAASMPPDATEDRAK